MKKIKLKNGLTVIYKKKKTKAVVIEFLVKVGSNEEKLEERGISHFIEHLVFEGTKKRKNSQEIANEIEKVGGELNAYTSKERTCFFVKVLKKHFDLGLEVLTDLLQNPLFREEDIEKEKEIIRKEKDLIIDEPRFYQWVLFEKNLYGNSPPGFPIYGSEKVIKKLNREKIVKYYKKYYCPQNMILSLVGEIDNWEEKIKKKWEGRGKKLKTKEKKEKKGKKERRKEEVYLGPLVKKNKIKKEKRKIANSYLVLGYKTVPQNYPESYVLEVIKGILGRGQSGWLFQEIRGKRGLAYEVGVQHLCEKSYGYFAIYLSTDKEKIELVKKIILDQIERLKKINKKELLEAQTYLEGEFLLEIEDNQKLGDSLCFWEQVKKAEEMENFIKKIKKVSLEDVKKVVEKYFKKYCLVIIEGK